VKTTDEILKQLGKKESNLRGNIVSRMNLSDPSIERLIHQQNFWIQEGSPLPSERENAQSKTGMPINQEINAQSSPKIRNIDEASASRLRNELSKQ